MIKKTIDSANIAPEDKETVQAQKLKALDDLHGLAQIESKRFRESLLLHFETSKSSRTLLGKKLLSWVFFRTI
jgi:hypothetical protein